MCYGEDKPEACLSPLSNNTWLRRLIVKRTWNKYDCYMFIVPQLSVSESEYRNFSGTDFQELRYPFAERRCNYGRQESSYSFNLVFHLILFVVLFQKFSFLHWVQSFCPYDVIFILLIVFINCFYISCRHTCPHLI